MQMIQSGGLRPVRYLNHDSTCRVCVVLDMHVALTVNLRGLSSPLSRGLSLIVDEEFNCS